MRHRGREKEERKERKRKSERERELGFGETFAQSPETLTLKKRLLSFSFSVWNSSSRPGIPKREQEEHSSYLPPP
jgi:hypothetical protein